MNEHHSEVPKTASPHHSTAVAHDKHHEHDKHESKTDATHDHVSTSSSGAVPDITSMNKSRNGSKSNLDAAADARKKSFLCDQDNDKCPVCNKSVFKVESKICAGLKWHQSCFVCGGIGVGGCKKKLALDYSVHLSNPYCRMCYHKAALGPGGTGGRESMMSCLGEGIDEVPVPVMASSFGQARAEMPSLLAGVRVSERASNFGGSSQDRASFTLSGTQRGSINTSKCLACEKTVFLAEETRAAGHLWHKSCFTCGAASESKSGCHRVLAKDNFLQLSGVPFCKACYPIFSKDPNFRGIPVESKVNRQWKNPPQSPLKTLFNGEQEKSGEEESPEEFHYEEEIVMNPDEQIQIQLERELELMEGMPAAVKHHESDDDDKEDDVITKVQGGVAEWDYEGDRDDERTLQDDPPAQPFGVASKKNGRQVLTKVLSGFTAPFDKNGVLFHIGTAGGTDIYQNPHLTGAVTASMSSIYKGYVHHVVEQKRSLMPNYSNNTKRSWVAVDLGKGRRLMPTRYCIRHGASGKGNALRNWELRARERDTDGWTVLRAHYNDDAISELPYSAAAWKLRPPKVIDDNTDGIERAWPDSDGFRYFLILQMGLNSSNNDCFFIGGMELYGTLTEEEGLDE